MNSSLEDLLLPLLMTSLVSIKAAGAGITGAVSNFKDVEAVVNGKNQSRYTFPLAKNLLVLDLSRNNVSELGGLPVVPSEGRIGLQQNEKLVVPPQVLREAVTHEILLDLSDTKLSNREEAQDLLGAVKTTEMYHGWH